MVQDVPKSEVEKYSGNMYVLRCQRSRQQRGARGRFDEADWACESRAREMVGLISILEVHVHDGYCTARCRCCRCRREKRRASAQYGGRRRMNGWGGWNPEWISAWVLSGVVKDAWMVQGNWKPRRAGKQVASGSRVEKKNPRQPAGGRR